MLPEVKGLSQIRGPLYPVPAPSSDALPPGHSQTVNSFPSRPSPARVCSLYAGRPAVRNNFVYRALVARIGTGDVSIGGFIRDTYNVSIRANVMIGTKSLIRGHAVLS